MTYLGLHTMKSQSTGLSNKSEFIRHDPCEECGSSDAKAVYEDGSTYCFSCQHSTRNGEQPTVHIHTMSNVNLQGSAVRLNKRGLSQHTCEFYKIYRDGELLQFPYYSSDGVLKGKKVRNKRKDFSYEGETPGTFFGQHNFRTAGTRIVITEGELDAASVAEAIGTDKAVVSLPLGAAGAKKSIQQNLEWLQSASEICLFFDNDQAGREATEKAASVLPPGKVTVARMASFKDASDALQAGQSKEIRDAIYGAATYRPDGIIDSKALLSVVCTPDPPCEYDYPYIGLQKKLHGIRYSELTTITSGSGIGKSSFCRELCTHLLEQGERVGYVALEESNRRTALGLMSSALGTNLNLGEHNVRKLTEAYDASLDRWNLFLFDGFGSFDPDIIYNRIEYLALGLDCRIIFLDHLSILMSGLDGDERRMLDITMTRLRSLVERCGIHLFLVSHLRRTQNDQNHEEGARVTLGQLRGSAAIAQLSDQVIALERDQQSGDGNSQTTVRILKNRYSGETGIACYLDYNLETCRFTENEIKPEFDPASDF